MCYGAALQRLKWNIQTWRSLFQKHYAGVGLHGLSDIHTMADLNRVLWGLKAMAAPPAGEKSIITGNQAGSVSPIYAPRLRAFRTDPASGRFPRLRDGFAFVNEERRGASPSSELWLI